MEEINATPRSFPGKGMKRHHRRPAEREGFKDKHEKKASSLERVGTGRFSLRDASVALIHLLQIQDCSQNRAEYARGAV